MSKKLWAVLTAGALIASVFSAVPAQAADVPAAVQIDDPVGDANGLNDQDNAYGTPAAGQGDHVGPAGGTATDILKVWFSNTATDISLSFQTKGDPNNLIYDTYFRFSSNPGKGSVAGDETRGCFLWVASINGAAGGWQGETGGSLTDKCNVGDAVAGPLVTEEGPESTFITTMTFPRSYSPLLADGGTITDPFGVSRVLYVGPSPTTAAFVTLDNTKRGTDYAIQGGETPAGPPVATPVPIDETPVKKGCKNGKGEGKKKGCNKEPKAAKCGAFTPAEQGKDAETTVVTDAATAEAPIETHVVMDPAVGLITGEIQGQKNPLTSDAYFNVQVDPKAPSTGLYVRVEFPFGEDYDLYLIAPDGSDAAHSGAANQVLDVNDGTGNGGHGEETAEQIDGALTNDCGGYTVHIANAFGQGHAILKYWLGTPTWDPASQSGIPAKAYV